MEGNALPNLLRGRWFAGGSTSQDAGTSGAKKASKVEKGSSQWPASAGVSGCDDIVAGSAGNCVLTTFCGMRGMAGCAELAGKCFMASGRSRVAGEDAERMTDDISKLLTTAGLRETEIRL